MSLQRVETEIVT